MSPAQKAIFTNGGVAKQSVKKAFTSNHKFEVGGPPNIPRQDKHHIKFISPPFIFSLLFKIKLRVEDLV